MFDISLLKIDSCHHSLSAIRSWKQRVSMCHVLSTSDLPGTHLESVTRSNDMSIYIPIITLLSNMVPAHLSSPHETALYIQWHLRAWGEHDVSSLLNWCPIMLCEEPVFEPQARCSLSKGHCAFFAWHALCSFYYEPLSRLSTVRGYILQYPRKHPPSTNSLPSLKIFFLKVILKIYILALRAFYSYKFNITWNALYCCLFIFLSFWCLC